MLNDVLIVGGGPAGLSAALALGRARKRVLLCDAGPRRNAAAEHVHGFVTRDGVTPADFRRIGRQQLEPYGNVELRDVAVEEISGERGAFEVRLTAGQEQARRVLHVEFVEGGPLRRDVLFVHPPQRQVDIVRSLALALDSEGLVQVDETSRETSTPGIYAAGDLVMRAQGAMLAAASGFFAAARLNQALTAELATSGGLP